MKKVTIISLVSLCAAGVYAQGTLSFSDYIGGNNSSIYAPLPSTTVGYQSSGWLTGEVVGNTTAQTPAGSLATSTYTTPIGGSTGAAGTPINYAYGNNFSVTIYWTPETVNLPTSRLVAGSTYLSGYYNSMLTTAGAWNSTTFVGQGMGNPSPSYVGTMATSSTVGAGFFQAGTQSQAQGLYGDVQTQADAAGNNASGNPLSDNKALITLACWYNGGGSINSYAAAVAAGVPYGLSLPTELTGLGESAADWTAIGGSGPPPTTPPLGVTSFSLVNPVPEPSTIALGVMGVCAFLARRRMK
jgi:hypothetical protein